MKKISFNLETFLKEYNEEQYLKYIKFIRIYMTLLSNIKEFKGEDRIEILSFFCKCMTEKVDIFSYLEKENFIFPKNKVKEKLFSLVLDYFKNREVLNLSNSSSIAEIEKKSHIYPLFLISNLKKDSHILKDLYQFENENLDTGQYTQFYSDEFYELFIITDASTVEEFMPTHYLHSGISFRFCETGQIRFSKNNLVLNEKEMLISKGIYLGGYQPLTKDVFYVYVHIKQNFLDSLGLDFPKFVMDKLNWNIDKSLLDTLISCKDHKYIRLILLRFVTDLLLRITNLETQSAPKKSSKKKQDSLARDIKAFIEENLENRILISEIQQKFGINKNNLIKLFNEKFNMGPSKYVLNRKLEAAARLLLETNLSVSQIVDKLSFPTASSFSKFFKEKYALTPLSFRKSMGETKVKGNNPTFL